VANTCTRCGHIGAIGGVRVVVIESGYFRSGFLNEGGRVEARSLKEYEGTAASRGRAFMNDWGGRHAWRRE
jgi:hypothetical protein